jgi:hypothetical protein
MDWIGLSCSVLFYLWALANMVMNIRVPVTGGSYVEHVKYYQIPRSDGALKI